MAETPSKVRTTKHALVQRAHSYSPQSPQPQAKGETDVTIAVTEKGYLTAYTGTSVTRDDVAWDLSASLRNPTGHAEAREMRGR